MNRVYLEPLPGEFIANFTQRMCDAVHSSQEPSMCAVLGEFNQVELIATCYSTKQNVMKIYHHKRFNSNGEWE